MITPEQTAAFEANELRWTATFAGMAKWLPDECSNFLDIGCGLGGQAILVSNHYNGRATANLIDAQSPSPKWVRWRKDGEAYADVNVALEFFATKLPRGTPVIAWPPRNDAPVPPCELIYSNVSWGHHYPITTYIGLVDRCLKPGGVLIVDLRRRFADVAEVLLATKFIKFGEIMTPNIDRPKKYRRTVWGRA